MRQFEKDDVEKAAAGDLAAQFRVQRRKDVIRWNSDKYKAAVVLATPSWRDKKVIRAIYQEARRLTSATGIKHEVDHIVPIQGQRVCGLHVEFNLQVISKTENIRKHAKFRELNNFEQLEKMGLRISSGKRKLNAALKVGPVLAVGDRGVCYWICMHNGQLNCIHIGVMESTAAICELMRSQSASEVIFVDIINATAE